MKSGNVACLRGNASQIRKTSVSRLSGALHHPGIEPERIAEEMVLPLIPSFEAH